ncbi:hypothetical protein GSI_10471 [Ganoderma sinense ZZ0214-1]|uniref:Uncharacterized protein n=1 Tax=Ganoderma sinense ZZ0214-1 TaxID=1077348 RepID=A0A2G8S0R4_9APHY|nr:hypothetical protein GSI_10471 [Ganoderma sinense ZZ0214-1]
MAALASFSPRSPFPLDPLSQPRWDGSFDDTLSANNLAGTDRLLDFSPEVSDSTEVSLCGCVGGCRLFHDIDVPWKTEDYLPPTLEGTEPHPYALSGFGGEIGNPEQAVPPTLADHQSNTPRTEADHKAQPDDVDQEVSFDWDEDTPGIVLYPSARKHDEDNSVEVEDGDGREDEDENDDSAKEDTDESDSDSDDDDVIEGEEAIWTPVLSGTTQDDVSEEEDVTEDENIIPTTVSDSRVTLTGDGASPTPQSEWSSHGSEDSVVDKVPSPTLKSRLQPLKRLRSNEESDEDGDDSGDCEEPSHRPKKKTRRALSRDPLVCDRASPFSQSKTLSASDTSRKCKDGGMPARRVSRNPLLSCGFPGCNKILRESDSESLKNARKHYRDHFKNKDGSWVVRTPVTCNWSGCSKKFNLGDVACQRHLERDHFKMLHLCPICTYQSRRLDLVGKHQLRYHSGFDMKNGVYVYLLAPETTYMLDSEDQNFEYPTTS